MTTDLDELRDLEVLLPADVHVTDTVVRLTGEHDPESQLAIALAVRAPRLGHVCLDLGRIVRVGLAAEGRERIDVELPDLERWLTAIAAAPSVRRSDEDRVSPLVLDDGRLYLDRYWRYEQRLVDGLRALLDRHPRDRDPSLVQQLLDRLFPNPDDAQQRAAAEVATREALTVLTGGPGTGKTTTVVKLLATLWLSAGDEPPSIVVAAPTGKAAARLAEAVRQQADGLPVPPAAIAALRALPTSTLHRLLGWRPDAPTRFRHDRQNPLPNDIVVVDEASMASLPLMTKLVDALGPGGRLVLVGDRDQLASVDAGAVLSDICGPRGDDGTSVGARAAETIVTLTRFHRFGPASGIGAVARAVQREGTGPDDVLALFRGERTEPGGPDRYTDIALIDPARDAAQPLPAPVLDHVVEGYAAAVSAAIADHDPLEVLAAFDRLRVLTALRRGPDGVDALTEVLGARIAAAVPGYEHDRPFPIGQPVLVTRNDHQLGLFNGDVGVVVRDPRDERRRVAFPTAEGGARLVAPARIPAAEPVFAMSVHKSQGSQFEEVVLVLPRRDSPLLSRELIYTGVTRAARHVTVVADAQVLHDALGRRVQRASGLTRRLWHPDAS